MSGLGMTHPQSCDPLMVRRVYPEYILSFVEGLVEGNHMSAPFSSFRVPMPTSMIDSGKARNLMSNPVNSSALAAVVLKKILTKNTAPQAVILGR